MSSSMMNCYLVGASGLKQMRGFVAPSRMPKVVPRELRVREAVAWLVRKKRSGAHWAPLIKHVIPKLIGHSSEGAGIYIYIYMYMRFFTNRGVYHFHVSESVSLVVFTTCHYTRLIERP